MPSPIGLADFKRWFRKYDVEFKPAGKHFKMVRSVGGKQYVFPLPTVNGREVLHCYLASARRKLLLTPENGVSDKAFFGKD